MEQFSHNVFRVSGAGAWIILCLSLGCSSCESDSSQNSQEVEGKKSSEPAIQKVGLSLNDPRAAPGYTLLNPMTSNKTYLIDLQGRIIQKWQSDCYPALSARFLENGHLLRTGTLSQEKRPFGGAGAGGRVQEFNWDGELVWDFVFSNDRQLPHHDLTKLPNGNVLLIVWENKNAVEAIAAGRKPSSLEGNYLRSDSLIEIQPTGKTTGKIVWEWHIWDHLIQDYDRSVVNHGDVAAHPERIDINFGETADPLKDSNGNVDKLRSIGYLRSGPPGSPQINPGWAHINSVAYNAEHDQVAVSVLSFNEVWIIDHSTTLAEAAGHSGGRRGRGGDLLYRWGNPRAYRTGTAEDQQFFGQHSADWIPPGMSGAGHLLVFNNGTGRPDGNYSSVDELVLPVDANGNYTLEPSTAYLPEKPVWSYRAPKKEDFYSELISGAQRLSNGTTLICSGISGRIFEVTTEGDVVWDYMTPFHRGPDTRWGPVPASTSVFRAYRYAPDYPGLAGKKFTPGPKVEEQETSAPKSK
jgi:Arylsulfotransferase (ASST)